MKRLAPALLVAAGLLAGRVAAADDKAPAELDALRWYEGSWTCQTFDYDAKHVKTAAGAATVHVQRALANHWYEVVMDIAPGKELPAGWHTHEFKGYDPKAKKWIQIALVSEAGGWAHLESAGLMKDTMVWTLVGEPKSTARGVMHRISDTEYEHTEEENGAATWSKHCTKAATR